MKNLLKSRVMSVLSHALLLACMSFGVAHAQTTTGTLRGVVTDTNGSLIAGATVTAINQGTGIKTSVFQTTGEGIYVIPNLVPGKYTLSVESTGFRKTAVRDVEVRLDVNTTNVTLQPGNVAETITVVSGTEELINTDQSQLSTSIDSRKIQDLPSNAAGDGLDTLALLIPGVVPGSQRSTNTNGEGLSVNGNRPRSNNFQIDGSDNNDIVIGGPSLFVSNQDQVQEFQVITNNFSAQYGRNQGAIVNIVTKGGTNEFHGSAFEYFRDQKHLDSLNNLEKRAVNPNDPSTFNPAPQINHVFGGVVGGPIIKNRAFFFGTYQGQRTPGSSLLQSGSIGIVKEEFPRLSAAFPGNAVIDAITRYSAFALPLGNPRPSTAQIGTVQIACVLAGPSPIVPCGTPGSQGPFKLGGPYDVVNLGGTFFQAAFIERTVPTPSSVNEYSIRGDAKLSDRDNITARYLNQKGLFINSNANTNGYSGDTPFTTRNLGGTHIHQFSSSMVNELRPTYQKLFVKFGGGCDSATPGCIDDPATPDKSQADINFTGGFGLLNPTTNLRFIGPGGTQALFFPQGRLTTVYQLADNLTITRGSHSILAGGEFKYTKSENPGLPSFQGSYTFNSSARILNNAPSSFALSVGEFSATFDQYDQYYYVQDDWKLRENLTLNLGVRYEYYGAPINDLNDITLARESGSKPLFNPGVPLADRIVPRVSPDKNNFAPRLGFAYTPHFWRGIFGQDATVFRGGFSIAYETPFYNILTNVAGTAPVVASFTLATGSPLLPPTGSPLPLPTGFAGDVVREQAVTANVLPIGQLDPRLLSQTTVAPDFHSPYSRQWSFGMQRQLGRNHVIEVRYVGNHGIGLFQNQNPNPIAFNLANGFTRNVPGFGSVTFPAFPQFVPSGVTPIRCTNISSTPDNEGACDRRITAGHGAITQRTNSGESSYHAMQTRYNGRFLRNSLIVGAAYSWSKTLDDASEIFSFSENSSFAQNPFDTHTLESSFSALDRPNAFSANFIYDIPYFKEQRGLIGHLLGGFQINGTYVLTSGRRFTPGQSFSSSLGNGSNYEPSTGNALRPFLGNATVDQRLVGISQIDAALLGFGTPVVNPNGFWSLNALNSTGDLVSVTPNDVRFIFNGPGAAKIFGTPFGTTPRNYLQGPALNQMNLGFFKTTRVTENLRVQFRAELYNALNHPSPGYGITNFSSNAFTIPVISIESAGVNGSAFGDNGDISLNRRVIQFGLRIIF